MTTDGVLERAVDRGFILAAVAVVVYGCLASSQIVGNDNAELSTLAITGGVAHPSGYPLYTLWLRAWSWLPGSTPAHTAALATIPIAVASLVALHAACRAWGARPFAATVAVSLFATSGMMLRVNTEAEVFPINDLVVATVLWLAATNGPLRGVTRAAVLGVVAGLGLSNNLTCALVAPVGLLGVVRGAREARAATALPAAIGGLLLGLSPYLYLFAAANPIISWRHPDNFGDLVAIATRKQYGGTFGFTGADAKVLVGAQLEELGLSVARMLRWAGLPIGVVAIGVRIWRPRGETRAGWIALAACVLLAGPILVTRFDIEPVRMGLYVVHRFHILPALFLVVGVASGVEALVAAAMRDREPAKVRPAVSALLAAVGFLALVAASLPELARFHSPALENGVRGLLLGVPENAIMLTTTDEFDSGFHYEQLARHERPDVTVFRPHVAGYPWYAEHVRELGVPVADGDTTVQIIAKALATGRPVFINRVDRKLLRDLPSYPFGQFDRVLPPGSALPSLDAIFEENKQLYSTFDVAYPRPGPDDEFATGMHVWLAAPWQRLGDAYTRQGNRAAADACNAIATQLLPGE